MAQEYIKNRVNKKLERKESSDLYKKNLDRSNPFDNKLRISQVTSRQTIIDQNTTDKMAQDNNNLADDSALNF